MFVGALSFSTNTDFGETMSPPLILWSFEFFYMLIGDIFSRCAQVVRTTQEPLGFVWSAENGCVRPAWRPTRGSKLPRTTRFTQRRMLTPPPVRWLTLTMKDRPMLTEAKTAKASVRQTLVEAQWIQCCSYAVAMVTVLQILVAWMVSLAGGPHILKPWPNITAGAWT